MGDQRFAAIADIHGNADALAAVLDDIEDQGIEQVINLGDVFSGPLDAAGVAKQLRPHDWPTIRGNHDRYLIAQTPDQMAPSDAVAYAQLDTETLDWLRELQPTVWIGDDIFACHGTPQSDDTYWMERATSHGGVAMGKWAHIEAAAEGIGASLILCAHTHIPRLLRLADGRLLANPGSVGCPAYSDETPLPHIVETGAPDARYAIFQRNPAGWSASFRSVPYDPTRMIAMAREHGRPEWAEALATGRITRKMN